MAYHVFLNATITIDHADGSEDAIETVLSLLGVSPYRFTVANVFATEDK